MSIPLPAKLEHPSGVYDPLTRLLVDTLVKPKDLAARWSFSDDHLSSLRRRNIGPAWIRLPTAGGTAKRPLGAIRYRLSSIIAAELSGTHGALTFERVALAIVACDFLSEEQRAALIMKLKRVLA